MQIKKKKLLVITIDFEKCFDRIEYTAIFGSLRYFGFGEKIIQLIKLFFKDFRVCTQNVGYCSEMFFKIRSVNQGCPVSPYLYLLCGEILAHKLQENKHIQGVLINDIRLLMSQFADDTILYLNWDKIELEAALETLLYIETQTDLKISYDKTTVYRVGSAKNSNAKIYTNKQLQWSDDDIDLLGVKIPNGDTNRDLYRENINKMTQVCTNWYN